MSISISKNSQTKRASFRSFILASLAQKLFHFIFLRVQKDILVFSFCDDFKPCLSIHSPCFALLQTVVSKAWTKGFTFNSTFCNNAICGFFRLTAFCDDFKPCLRIHSPCFAYCKLWFQKPALAIYQAIAALMIKNHKYHVGNLQAFILSKLIGL